MRFEGIYSPVITTHRPDFVILECGGKNPWLVLDDAVDLIIATPFGGYGQSGFGGRDNGVHVFDRYTRLKALWIDTVDCELGSGIA